MMHLVKSGYIRTTAILCIFMFGLTFAQSDKNQAENSQIENISLITATGEKFQALLSGPENASVGVILVHDWFGVTDFYHDALNHLSKAGYRTLAVDLYGGKSAASHKEAFALMKEMNTATAKSIIEASIHKLKRENRQLAIMGFSMGAPVALGAAIDFPDELSAAIIWYGDTETDTTRLSSLKANVLVIGGGKDGPEGAYKFSELMESLNKSAEIHIFPGLGHAFAQPLFNQGKNFDEAATRTSWLLTEDFLNRILVR